MKRKVVFLFVLVFAVSSCFASYDMFEDNLSFDWYAAESLFPSSALNPFSSTSTLNILHLIEGQPRSILYTDNGEYTSVPFYSGTSYADETLYAQLKTGVNIGLLRLSFFDMVESEVGFQGALNSVFQGFGGAKNLGFDGIFFFGLHVRFFNTVTFRTGYQHYSGHYGDETLLNITGQTEDPVEYVRDNDILFGVSVQPVSFLRLYADANLPLPKTWMAPAIHIPFWVLKPSSGESLLEVESGKEGIAVTEFADSYKAWIIDFGMEVRLPVRNLGSLLLGADVVANQDGQTLHQVGGYDEDNPWEFEYTLGAGLEFDQSIGLGATRLMLCYHDGRFPLLNFFYQRTKYLSVGFSISQ
ncbi:Protein of unknown function (DUF1207) [Sphaerochaeta pleomorpha str. Grapes]|uniref:Bacterial surface antigen (D15) domain-containing protein n=1 Tax=Sphaerochaeta pleomorpha (strain ATCC BAA-1885 / DSM 22778 / Grapes) TaxID=158190 RepID=G8QVC6_SPHPG|nr:hypothetical protein [Sphaerochaeta pleomorpha]AEV30441.1 Protein of unknown function (DUF1207) [Sphaerochaeta pleomorpha str. Grapes]